MSRKKDQPLSDKEEAFLEHYLQCWNAAEAARRAGYSPESARFTGRDLLTKPHIQKAKEERLLELKAQTDELHVRLTEQARSDIGEFIGDDGSIDLTEAKETGRTRLISEYQVEETTRDMGELGSSTTIKKKIKLYSAQKAQQFLFDRVGDLPEVKKALLELQTALLERKVKELKKKEELLDLLKRKAPKEVYLAVLRLLTEGDEEEGEEAPGGGTRKE